MAGKKKKQQDKRSEIALREGVVTRSTGTYCTVTTPQGEAIECVVRGKFRIAGLSSTNPVAVGDQVRFQPPGDAEQEPGVVREILPRKNYMLRRAITHTRKAHILAANLDQAILLFTLSEPATSTGFADRFLVVAEAYHIPAVVVVNKIDLLGSPEDQQELQALTELYERIGYPVIRISALDPAYHSQVSALLQHKVSFIGGHSGSGKSGLLNMIDPRPKLRTGEISGYSQKGTHTTTHAQMFALTGGGYIIDSPGIKELGLTGFEREELSHFFPEMRRRMADCRFSNCSHVHEPGCAVRAALEQGEVAASRYQSYLSMLADIDEAQAY